MRGLIAVSLLLVALIVLAGFIGTTVSAGEKLRSALSESLQQERVFYAGSDVESAFWKTVTAATHESATIGEDSQTSRQRLLDYLSVWTAWASNNYEVDAKIDVLTGVLDDNDANSLELRSSRKFEPKSDNEMILSTRRDFEIPISTSGETIKVAVYVISVTRTLDSGGIYVRVSEANHRILNSIPAGAHYACYSITDGADLIGASGIGSVLDEIESSSGVEISGSC